MALTLNSIPPMDALSDGKSRRLGLASLCNQRRTRASTRLSAFFRAQQSGRARRGTVRFAASFGAVTPTLRCPLTLIGVGARALAKGAKAMTAQIIQFPKSRSEEAKRERDKSERFRQFLEDFEREMEARRPYRVALLSESLRKQSGGVVSIRGETI